VAVFYLSIVAILVGTNSRREEEDETDEEHRCQVKFTENYRFRV
jgi:hypothetical protein